MSGRTDYSVVEVKEVDLVRAGKHLLSDLSISIRPGQHWALLGPNGAGKSTVLSLLAALTHPTRGSVHILGHLLGRVDTRQLRALIGHVNPRHQLDYPLSSVDVVLTGLTNTSLAVPRKVVKQEERDRACHLLATMGMGDRLEAVWTTMSQGERGRVLIARALVSNPSLLLLDEPATGLDLAAREQLLAALDALRQDVPQLATVLVTHHLEELPTVTSHAALISGGKIQTSGTVEKVLTSAAVSACFGYDVTVTRTGGRWGVRAQPVQTAHGPNLGECADREVFVSASAQVCAGDV